MGWQAANVTTWVASTIYKKGDLVISPASAYTSGLTSLMQCSTSHTSGGSWAGTNWLRVADIGSDAPAALRNPLAPVNWASSTAYTVGQLVFTPSGAYSSGVTSLVQVNTAHTSGGSYDSSKFTRLADTAPTAISTSWSATGLSGATAQPTRLSGGTTNGPPTTGTFAVGDTITDSTGAVWYCTVAGSPGTWGLAIGQTLNDYYMRPTGVFAESIPRAAGHPNTTLTLTSGTLYLQAIVIIAGTIVSKIGFTSVGAATSPTHYWFGLFDSSRNALALTADQLTTAWGATTTTKLSIATVASGSASSYTVTSTGLYYIGIMQTASTPATISGAGMSAATIQAAAPALFGSANTGQTTVPAFPFQASALTTSTAAVLYGTVGS